MVDLPASLTLKDRLFDGLVDIITSLPAVIAFRGWLREPLELQGTLFAVQPSVFAGGRFSNVHRANLVQLNRDIVMVAVKVPRAKKDDDMSQWQCKFERESRIWSSLHHANITPFYGLVRVKEQHNLLCLVSPLCQNGTVKLYLERNPLVDKLRIISEITFGIEYLHGLGIIHGDIKPGNILINDDGRPWITDFSASCRVNDATTTPRSPFGTTRYMARELLVVSDDVVVVPTTAADVCSLGLSCMEVVTGVAPFQHLPEVAVLAAIMRGDEPFRERPERLELHPEVNGLVMDLLKSCWNPLDRRPCAPNVSQVFRFALDVSPQTPNVLQLQIHPDDPT